eukprot:TRINITY_DN30872_c0_g1_i1.p1 TRINITY_DN30872_c0_g1~~TRINITY_DN30872_c0_g1_i1.p1  ORF type:complete len:525 (+),score=112.13 TRINITY_DN30872_c0_g1_i1:133-1707(+)
MPALGLAPIPLATPASTVSRGIHTPLPPGMPWTDWPEEPPLVAPPPLPKNIRGVRPSPPPATPMTTGGVGFTPSAASTAGAASTSGAGAAKQQLEEKPHEEMLTRSEALTLDRCIELAVAFGKRSDPKKLMESLGKTLALFPTATGRLAVRHFTVSEPGEGPSKEDRMCIVCTNTGIPFTTREVGMPMPSLVGPLPSWCFDRVAVSAPEPTGAVAGDPLLRIRLLSFADGRQLLCLSVARVLADIGGIAVLLDAWVAMHRGEEVPAPSERGRHEFEAGVRNIRPRLHADFALLRRSENAEPCQPMPDAVLASRLWTHEELNAMCEDLSTSARKQRFIFNSDAYTAEEVCVAVVAEVFQEAKLPVTFVLDYREVFAVEFAAGRLFGSASGKVEFELPCHDAVEAASVVKKRLKVPLQSRDFWAWKLSSDGNRGKPETSRLVVESLTGAMKLDKLAFDGGASTGIGMSAGFWQDCVRFQAKPGGAGAMLLLPHADGLQVAALIPKAAATDFQKRHGCDWWHEGAMR